MSAVVAALRLAVNDIAGVAQKLSAETGIGGREDGRARSRRRWAISSW